MMKKATAIVSLALAASVLAASAHAATNVKLIEYAKDDKGRIKQSYNTLYIDEGRFFSAADSGDSVSIFRDRKLYLLNPDDNSYSVMSKEILAKRNEIFEHSKRANSVTVPEVKREVRPTATKTLVGNLKVPCEVWYVYENDKLAQLICTVPFSLLFSGRVLQMTMLLYNDMMAGFESSTSSLPWRDMNTTNGFPVLAMNFVDNEFHSGMQVYDLDVKALYMPFLFELPAGMHEGSDL